MARHGDFSTIAPLKVVVLLHTHDSLPAVQIICHGIPDKRELQNGDIVNVDVTAYFKGCHGDLNETFVVGEVDDESKKLLKVTYEVGPACVVGPSLC